jgi:hypothetical protein
MLHALNKCEPDTDLRRDPAPNVERRILVSRPRCSTMETGKVWMWESNEVFVFVGGNKGDAIRLGRL